MTLQRTVLVALGGLVGCVARYWLSGTVQGLGDHTFPTGTLAVNVTGSLLIGLVMTLSLERGLLDEDLHCRLLATKHSLSSGTANNFSLLETPASRLPHAWSPRGPEASWGGYCEDTMKITGQGTLLRIFAGESDNIHGKYTHGGSET